MLAPWPTTFNLGQLTFLSALEEMVSLPTIGEVQNATNLLFATQPSYAYGEVDKPSDGLSETNTKLALRKYQAALLQMHYGIDQSIRSKALSRLI